MNAPGATAEGEEEERGSTHASKEAVELSHVLTVWRGWDRRLRGQEVRHPFLPVSQMLAKLLIRPPDPDRKSL